MVTIRLGILIEYNIKNVVLVSIFFTILGILFFSISYLDYLYSLKTNEYEQTNGLITRFERVKQIRKIDTIILNYQYTVNGVLYHGKKFSNGVGDIREFEKKFINNNNTCKVYYDRKSPHKSVLVKGGRRDFFDGLMMIGSMLLLFGICGYLSLKYSIFKNIWTSMFG